MIGYRNWKIRSKLLVPLVAMGLVSSIAVIATALLVFQNIRDHTLLELQNAYRLQSTVIELVGEYREYLNLPSPAVLQELEKTKSDLRIAFDSMTERSPPRSVSLLAQRDLDAVRSDALEQIEDDLRLLSTLGDQLVSERDAVDETMELLEDSEEEIDRIADSLYLVVAELIARYSGSTEQPSRVEGSVSQLRALSRVSTALHAYISEIREYLLEPSDDARSDLVEFSEEFQSQFALLATAAATEEDEAPLIDGMAALLDEVTSQSDSAVLQRDNLGSSLMDLEALTTTFQRDLESLTDTVSSGADAAVRRGVIIVSVVTVTTLVLTYLVHWWISRVIASPIAQLRDVAVEFGQGNLAARSPVRGDDDIGALASAFNDMAGNLSANIDALQEAQEDLVRKERLAAVGQLTATVSHELRNPLGAMRSATEAIAKLSSGDDAQLTRAIRLLERGQARCDRIIAELLDFVRVRELSLSLTGMDAWLSTLLDDYEMPPGVTLERRLACDCDALIDRDRLERSVENVISNACDAMTGNGGDEEPADRHVLTVATRIRGGRLEIAICDTGPGIPPEQDDKIFEPLFSTKSFGVGLGLPIVRQIMEQHEGGIEIDSEPGRGTDVILWLPAPASALEGTAA